MKAQELPACCIMLTSWHRCAARRMVKWIQTQWNSCSMFFPSMFAMYPSLGLISVYNYVIRVTCVYFHVKLNHTIGWATVGHSCSHDSAIQGWDARSLWHLGKAHLHGDMWYSSLFLHVFAKFFHAFVCVCVSPKVKRDRLNQTCHDEMIRQVLLRRGQKDTFTIGRGYI